MKNIEKVSLGVSTFIDKARRINELYEELAAIGKEYSIYVDLYVTKLEELKKLVLEEKEIYENEELLSSEDVVALYDDIRKYQEHYNMVDLLLKEDINIPYYRVIARLYDKIRTVNNENIIEMKKESKRYDSNRMFLLMIECKLFTLFINNEVQEEYDMTRWRNKFLFLNPEIEAEALKRDLDFEKSISLRSDLLRGCNIPNDTFVTDMINAVMPSLYIDEYSAEIEEEIRTLPVKLFLLGSIIPLCNNDDLTLINEYREDNLEQGGLDIVDEEIEEYITNNPVLTKRLERVKPSKLFVKTIESRYNKIISD